MSTHLRSEAIRQLKEMVGSRVKKLQASDKISGVVNSVGMKGVNLLRSDMAPTVCPKRARAVLIALGFQGEDLNTGLTLHTIARSSVGGPQSPRRNFRNLFRFHHMKRARSHESCRRQSGQPRSR